jgi:hypothetical protein
MPLFVETAGNVDRKRQVTIKNRENLAGDEPAVGGPSGISGKIGELNKSEPSRPLMTLLDCGE